MEVCFWGVRGSIPTPPTSEDLRNKITRVLELAAGIDISTAEKREQFLSGLSEKELGFIGGNTPCVELKVKDKIFIFDMGTGLREFGNDLLKRLPKEQQHIELHIFIGHTHWDHVQGFPFFVPAYRNNVELHFYFVHPQVKERLEIQQDYRFFPVAMEFMASKKHFHQIENNSQFMIDDIVIKTTELNHPGKCFAYRVEYEGKSFIYASDGEYNYLPSSRINKFIEFYDKADMLVFDAPFSFSEEIEKINWGHSSALLGIDLSVKAKVKELILFHHAPENDDEAVFQLLQTAEEYREKNYSSSPLEVLLARERMKITI